MFMFFNADDDKKNSNSAFLASMAKSLKAGKGNPPALQTVYPQVPWQTATHPMGLFNLLTSMFHD